MKKNVIIGLLGSTKDARGKGKKRWDRWRPSISLFQHEIVFDRFELIYQEQFRGLMEKIIQDVHEISPHTEINLNQIIFNDPWNLEEVYTALHDFARNYPFDLENENYFLHISTGTHVAQICMFILAEARYFPVKLIQTGIERKEDIDPKGTLRIIDLDLSKFDKIASRFQNSHLRGENVLKSGIQTRNAQFNKMISQIEHVSIQSKSPILLIGPTGAGKTQLARRIYDLKEKRRQVQGLFVEVNCATLRGDMAMSMLFGHKKGSFTGANSDRDGLLKSANGGVLFLDEIGELGLDEQTMLLRALEDKRFLPVGADNEVTSDFQLIAGTNKDLFKLVTHGKFRDDLLARINLWTYKLPGLKDRKEDIEPNLDYELEKYAIDHSLIVRFNKEARELYLKFSESDKATWNGNFRDLSASVTRMSTLSNLGRINSDVVKEEIDRLSRNWSSGIPNHSFEFIKKIPFIDINSIDLFDRPQLNEVIRVCLNSKSLAEAGRKLFSVSREKKAIKNDSDRLKKYLSKFGLTWSDLS